MTDIKTNCGTCQHWFRYDSEKMAEAMREIPPEIKGDGPDVIYGECRRHPPSAVKPVDRTYHHPTIRGIWLRTVDSEWCSEWKQQEK